MRVVYTDDALADLDEILDYIDANYPAISSAFRQRLRAVTVRIGVWPESAEIVRQRSGVRMVPLIRYPNFLQDRRRCRRNPSRPPRGKAKTLGPFAFQQARQRAGGAGSFVHQEAFQRRRAIDQAEAEVPQAAQRRAVVGE